MKFFDKIMPKIKNLFSIIKIFKNWPSCLLARARLMKEPYFICCLRKGIKYKIRSDSPYDRWIIHEIWEDKDYNIENFSIEDGDIILDIGAQIGVFSVFAAKHNHRGIIYAIEPFVENFKLLEENLRLNKINNVIPLCKAVSGENKIKKLYISNDNTGTHSFFSEKNERFIDVQTVSLKSIIENYNIYTIDFLKMDCEGAEYEILLNCPNEIIKMIKKIAMEYHNIDGYRNVLMLKEFLEKKGFKVLINVNMLYARRESGANNKMLQGAEIC